MEKKSYKFQFDMCDIDYVSYVHQPVNSYVANRESLQEIVQTIPLVNLYRPSEKFMLVYIYYKSLDVITGTGYLSTQSSDRFRGMFTVSQAITNLLAGSLFNGVNVCSIKQSLNGSEEVYILNNENGQIVRFQIELLNGILTLESV
jgi:hypothetical protein